MNLTGGNWRATIGMLAIGWLLGATCGQAAETAAPIEETFAMAEGGLPAGWQRVRGNWHVADGSLVGNATSGEALVTFGDPSWQNYEFEVTATFLEVRDPTRWLALVVRAARDGSKPWSQVAFRQ